MANNVASTACHPRKPPRSRRQGISRFCQSSELAAALLFGASCGTAIGAPIFDLSTGAKPDGTLAAFGSLDDQWQVIAAPGGVALTSATVVTPSRSHFVNLESGARWISPSTATNIDAPWGHYTYEIQFSIDLGSLSGLSISGLYAADNRLIDIRLNGNVAFVGPNVSGASCSSTGCDEFTSATAFYIDAPSFFADGLNRFQVTIENQGPTTGNPTSFVLSGAVDASPVPEPPIYALLMAGLGMMGLIAHRRRLDA